VVGENEGGRGNATLAGFANYIHHHAKIQVLVVEAHDKAIGCFADDRKYPDGVRGACSCRDRRLQAERRHQTIAQIKQRLDPSRAARHHFLGGTPGIERDVVHRYAVGIDELRAGEQCIGVDVRLDCMHLHNGALPRG
jgi:hypothetical protein